jgi:elongation factor G
MPNLTCFFGIVCHRETIVEEEIAADMRSEAKEKREELIEHVSNVDDILGQMYLGKTRMSLNDVL